MGYRIPRKALALKLAGTESRSFLHFCDSILVVFATGNGTTWAVVDENDDDASDTCSFVAVKCSWIRAIADVPTWTIP